MEFVAATNNANKLNELTRMLAKYGHSVVSMASVGIPGLSPEVGKTFMENARAKAKEVYKLCEMPCIADDSGLEVDVLDGAPGVMSARFAGRHGDDEGNNKHLMKLLDRTPYAKRGAHFTCALVVILKDGSLFEAQGQCEGQIGFTQSGENGFGYDSLFYTNNASFADMTDAQKDEISHRAKALKSVMAMLPADLPKDAPKEDTAE